MSRSLPTWLPTHHPLGHAPQHILSEVPLARQIKGPPKSCTTLDSLGRMKPVTALAPAPSELARRKAKLQAELSGKKEKPNQRKGCGRQCLICLNAVFIIDFTAINKRLQT